MSKNLVPGQTSCFMRVARTGLNTKNSALFDIRGGRFLVSRSLTIRNIRPMSPKLVASLVTANESRYFHYFER
jgi:hypothetical protein